MQYLSLKHMHLISGAGCNPNLNPRVKVYPGNKGEFNNPQNTTNKKNPNVKTAIEIDFIAFKKINSVESRVIKK